MQKNYPGRLYRFFGVEVSMLFRGIWAIAHRFVDDFTKKKMTIHGTGYGPEIQEVIAAENLQ